MTEERSKPPAQRRRSDTRRVSALFLVARSGGCW